MRREGGVEAEGDKAAAECPAVLLPLQGAATSPVTAALRAGDSPLVAVADSSRQRRADGKARPALRSLLFSKARKALLLNRAGRSPKASARIRPPRTRPSARMRPARTRRSGSPRQRTCKTPDRQPSPAYRTTTPAAAAVAKTPPKATTGTRQAPSRRW